MSYTEENVVNQDIKYITEAYCFLRKHNNTIPSEILELMKYASILYVKHIEEIEEMKTKTWEEWKE